MLFCVEFYFLIFPFLLAQLDGSVVVIYKLNRFVEFGLSQLKRSFLSKLTTNIKPDKTEDSKKGKCHFKKLKRNTVKNYVTYSIMEASPSNANSGLCFVNFNQDFGCFVAVTSEGFRIFNADPLRQNKTECKSFMALAESVKNDGENTNVYLGPAINDVVAGKSRVVKVISCRHYFYFGCIMHCFSHTKKNSTLKQLPFRNIYSNSDLFNF